MERNLQFMIFGKSACFFSYWSQKRGNEARAKCEGNNLTTLLRQTSAPLEFAPHPGTYTSNK